MEIVDNGAWFYDDLVGVNLVKEPAGVYLSIEHENDIELGIYLSKENFEYFKKRINEIDYEELYKKEDE